MFRRLLISILLAALMMAVTGCHHTRVQNPIANIDSKQPDKVLFDRAMDALKHARYDVARMTLQTLINTYPDSEYVARAKLAVGDTWYAEGGTTGLAQAEIEYKDFITFFPNMPEAAEAQLKVANIHYRQMEKPDRDFTHARRAEEEYRQLLLQFPDSKLVPQAQQRLREVQEVLAEREYRIGRFYAMREAWAAAIARLRTVADTYPLYSKASDSLLLLGNVYEKEIQLTRASRATERAKGQAIQLLTDRATEAYSRIITRYPATDNVDDAKHRLRALGRPVPTPTPQAIAESKAEEDSRSETGRFGKLMGNFRKHPDVSETAKVGAPALNPPSESSAVDFVREVTRTMQGNAAAGGSTVSIETRKAGEPPPSQAVPTSSSSAGDSAAGTGNAPPNDSESTIPALKPLESNPAQATPPAANSPSSPATAPLPPQQANDAAQNPSPDAAAKSQTEDQAGSGQSQKDESASGSSSKKKKKKKKGLGKLNPF